MKIVKRVVSTGFWDDDLVINDFSPEDKYFMLYLLTNQYTTQLGIYYLPIKKAAIDIGYSEESIKVLLDRFDSKYDLITYSNITGEILIKNYLRHSIVKGGKPVYDCLIKEESQVKDKSLLSELCGHLIIYKDDVNLNNTIRDYIKHLSIYINDNENERIVDESWTNRYKEEPILGDFDVLGAFNQTFEKYGIKSGYSVAKQKWMDRLILVPKENRKAVALEIINAVVLFIADYDKTHPDDKEHKYVKSFERWLDEDCEYWVMQWNKRGGNNA